MEKVENLCRTATAQQIFPTRRYTSDHACAIPLAEPAADPAPVVTRRQPQARGDCRPDRQVPFFRK
jgi:hypothetical protein